MEHIVICYAVTRKLPKQANGERVQRVNFGSLDIVADLHKVARNVARQFNGASVAEYGDMLEVQSRRGDMIAQILVGRG